MILTDIMIICMALVFSMLLKEKAAPSTKKTISQNQKVFRMSTSPNNFESTFPVMMHLEMRTPNRQMDTDTTGTKTYFSPQRILNCSLWSKVVIVFCPDTSELPDSSAEGIYDDTDSTILFSGSSEASNGSLLMCLLMSSMDSPIYDAALQLMARTMRVQMAEKTKPARKKGSGTISGPVPKSRLIVMNAALFLGQLSFFRSLLMPMLLKQVS